MTEIGFRQLINKHFHFLASTRSYKLEFVDDYPDPSIDDGDVKIVSDKTLIYVKKSRFDYVLTIRPVGEPEFTEMSPAWILEALAIPLENPPRDIRLSSFEWFLVRNVQLLNTHCKPFVVGDFSRWLDILEYFNNKTKEDYFIRTSKELPPHIYRDLEKYIRTKRLHAHYP